MTSNQDILTFLTANQEAHAKEKEEDKKTRAKERQEDRDNILKLIKIGVQKEVKAAVEDVEQRLEKQEKVNEELTKQLKSMIRDMELLKAAMVDKQTFPSLPPRPNSDQSARVQAKTSAVSDEKGHSSVQVMADQDARESVCAARRTVGFQCIYPEDVEKQFRDNGARSEDEARLLSVKEFSTREMKVSSEVFDEMEIERIFPPEKEDWNTLYVQFASVSSVQTFYKNSRYLQSNQRLVPYIPKELYPRFKELQSIAYSLRHSDMKYKTKVDIGSSGLLLYKRKPASGSWTAVLTSLPTSSSTKTTDPVHLNLRPQSSFYSSIINSQE